MNQKDSEKSLAYNRMKFVKIKPYIKKYIIKIKDKKNEYNQGFQSGSK
jgi:hypothetical protein